MFKNGHDMKRTVNHFNVLAAMPGTKTEIIFKTGLTLGQVRSALVHLRATKQAHIVGVKISVSGGRKIPVYGVGDAPDCMTTILPSPESVERDYLLKARKKIDQHIASLAGTQAQRFCLLPNARV